MLKLGRHQRLKNDPFRKFVDLFFHEVRRRIAERIDAVPSAELDLAKLWVIVCVPIDVALALVRFVGPFQELQIVFHWMIAEPVDVLVIFDASFAHRAPNLDDPSVRAKHRVEPVLRPGDDFFRVVFEIVEHADRGIAGELFALLALRLEHPQIFRRHFAVGLGAEGAQQHATPRMEKNAAANVSVRVDEFHARAHFGLARWEVARAELLAFWPPFFGEITV